MTQPRAEELTDVGRCFVEFTRKVDLKGFLDLMESAQRVPEQPVKAREDTRPASRQTLGLEVVVKP